MVYLDTFLNKYYGQTIGNNIYLNYKIFDYDDEETFTDDIDFLAKNIYNIRIVDNEDINDSNNYIILDKKFMYHFKKGECTINPETNNIVVSSFLENEDDIKYLLSLKFDDNISYNRYIYLLYHYKIFIENNYSVDNTLYNYIH